MPERRRVRARENGFTTIELLVAAVLVVLFLGGGIAIAVNMLGHGRNSSADTEALKRANTALRYLETDLRGSSLPDQALVGAAPDRLVVLAEASADSPGVECIVYQAGTPRARPDGSLTRWIYGDATCPGDGRPLRLISQDVLLKPFPNPGPGVTNPVFSYGQVRGSGDCTQRQVSGPFDPRVGNGADELNRIVSVNVRLTSYSKMGDAAGSQSAGTSITFRNRITQAYLTDKAGCTDEQ